MARVDATKEYESEHPLFQLELEWLDKTIPEVSLGVCAALTRILRAHESWQTIAAAEAEMVGLVWEALARGEFPTVAIVSRISSLEPTVPTDDEAQALVDVVRGDVLSGINCLVKGWESDDIENAIEGFSGTSVSLRYLWEVAPTDGYKSAINREFARRFGDLRRVARDALPYATLLQRIRDDAETCDSIFAEDWDSGMDPWNVAKG